MSLIDHAIWWHVYPLGACGAPIRETHGEPAHRLRRLDPWLDYAIELGCSGLLLGPIFASTAHGYDTLDHFRIDPRLGDDEDFDHLMAECNRRGLSVVLDGVFNHVGIDHPMVAKSLADPAHSLIRLQRDGDGVRPEDWEGHTGLANLDHSNPAVVDLVVDIMLHWLRRGIAGWRLDVAYAVPSEFWRAVAARVRAEFPRAIFIGEVIHGDYAGIARAGTLDTVTQYELWKAIWSSLKDQNFFELAWTLKRHAEFSDDLIMQTFVGNHDVSRIASLTGDAGAALAAGILLTTPGMPSIYYGDEQGFRGEKGTDEAADDPMRPPLPNAPADLVPNGEWLHRLYQDLISLRRRNPWITRGELIVETNDQTSISYRVEADGHTMSTSVQCAPHHALTVLVDGAHQFSWNG
ncbi:alpha-amylase family protein [Tessaracoccus antarcticus]|uniref:Alpha-amylase n=1 Tax=Tessaracoccus antarcticus TaxID=2479848 RepID=A0A3M0GME4_9ACTN|nr:alpha-amylase family protein [Tessaracoccus antarcticus]RMB62359.1 alpha-amylase [Tessaracoccus antarcticus]